MLVEHATALPPDRKYGDALAVLWIDFHPDMGTGVTTTPTTTPWSCPPLLEWLDAIGATKRRDPLRRRHHRRPRIQLGFGADLGGLSSAEARRLIADINTSTDVVGLTIAEYNSRQVIHLQRLLAGFLCSAGK